MKHLTQRKLKRLYRGYVVAAGLVGVSLLVLNVLPDKLLVPVGHAAGSATLYLSPVSGSHTVGTTFTVTIYESSGTQPINAVEADITYPATYLQYVSSSNTSPTNSDFNVPASNTYSSGSVKIAVGNISPLTGTHKVGTVTFSALKSGTANLTFANTSQAENNGIDYLGTTTGGTYTLATATTPPPPPPPPAPSPSPSPTPSPTTTTTKTTTTTTVTPTNNPKPVTVPSNSQVEVTAPATVQTTASGSSQSIAKVEYYLNGKKVATVTQAPFSFAVDTKKLLNGTYKLTSKTFYVNGTIDSKDTSMIVKNPYGLTQFELQLRHYSVFILLLLVAIGVGIWFLMRRQDNSYMGMNLPPQPPAGQGNPPVAHVGTM